MVTEMETEAYVYILKCADGTLYTGWTDNPKRRLAAHNAGTAAKYTRSRRPVEIALLIQCENRSAALKKEAEIKKLSRTAKLRLIAQNAEIN